MKDCTSPKDDAKVSKGRVTYFRFRPEYSFKKGMDSKLVLQRSISDRLRHQSRLTIAAGRLASRIVSALSNFIARKQLARSSISLHWIALGN